ncbi:MAG: PQQ-dependent sugar dehydrogenase [Polyangiales bacterium]
MFSTSHRVLVSLLFASSLAGCRDDGAHARPEEAPGVATVDGPYDDGPLERGFARVSVAEGFMQAVGFAFAPGGRILVAEKGGRVRVVQDGAVLVEPFVDLSVEVNTANDRGLLGIAVHPRFPAEPYVYLAYVYDPPEAQQKRGVEGADGNGARTSRVVRVEADPATGHATALPGSLVVLVGEGGTAENAGRLDARNDYDRPSCGTRGAYVADCIPADETSHTIGTVLFGPDEALYVGTGDGCDFTRAQAVCTRALDVGSLAGKILRIDPRTGRGLSDNPFFDGDAGSNASKVYQLGLRNPFRFAFGPEGALYVGDVGWNAWEEINRAGPGASFGWPCFEGGNGVSLPQPAYAAMPRCAELRGDDVTPAFYAYGRDGPVLGVGSAVMVGDVYRGSAYPPMYRGALFYADVNRRELRFVTFDEAGGVASAQLFQEGVGYPTQITSDPETGDLFVLALGSRPEAPESKLERIVFAGYGTGPAPGDYELRVAATQACVQTVAETTGEGALEVAAAPCRGDDAQRWRFEHVADDLYRFSSARAHEVLMLEPSREPTQVARLSAAAEQAEQRFRILPLGEGYQLINEASERCLATREGEGEVVLVGAPCATSAAQIFQIASAQNRAPTLALVPPQAHMVNTPIALQLAARDGEQADLTFFARGLPPGLSIDPLRGVIVGTLTRPGSYVVRLRVSDGELGAEQQLTWWVQDDKLPVVRITEPPEGHRYVAGERIAFAGVATTWDQQPIEPQQHGWDLIGHHNAHVHLDQLPTTLGQVGSFVAEDHGDNTALELCLWALDPAGRYARACRVIQPRTVAYTLDTEPSGLSVPWEGVLRQTPFTVETNVGGRRDLSAPASQEGFAFTGWSDGGDAAHVITVGATPARLVATYVHLPANAARDSGGQSI